MTNFPAERFLLESPPDYESERLSLFVKFFLVFILWSLIVPFFLAKDVVPDGDAGEKKLVKVVVTTLTTKTTITEQKSTKKSQSSNRGKKNRHVEEEASRNQKIHKTVGNQTKRESEKVIDPWTNMYCILGLVLHVIYIMLKSSPDNYYTTRSVFELPLFTDDECQFVVDMAERVARRNYETALNITTNNNDDGNNNDFTSLDKAKVQELLKEPYGWQKKRHNAHPTTDLNLVTDPFTKSDREWIQNKLDARLAPVLDRIFGVPPSSVRANDIFIIRYDGDRQASLEKHTDSGSITFSALLSDGFQGGGTRYYNRFKSFGDGQALLEPDGDPFVYVLPEKGMMQTFPGIIQHEGVQTEDGRRYLLIGFLDVDRVDPWTGRPTGLTWFASWGSLNWATTKVKMGWKELASSTSHKLRELFLKLQEWFVIVGELAYDHRFVVLVNKTSAKEYLNAMDTSYAQSRKSGSVSRATWFKGQQIDVGFNGSFRKGWTSRNENRHAFEEVATE